MLRILAGVSPLPVQEQVSEHARVAGGANVELEIKTLREGNLDVIVLPIKQKALLVHASPIIGQTPGSSML
jgi:hypothetical protein